MRDNTKSLGQGKKTSGGPRVNEAIRLSQCRLTSEDEQYGIVPMDEARRIAAERGMDLIEISPTADPPVVKMMDYGKFKYMQQKKVQEAKKKQQVVQLKEVQFRPNIEQHDLDVKLKRIDGFLDDGDKVKMVMQFRGREMAYREQGMTKFMSIVERVIAFGALIESEPKLLGNRIIAIVNPTKTKATPKKDKPKSKEMPENES